MTLAALFFIIAAILGIIEFFLVRRGQGIGLGWLAVAFTAVGLLFSAGGLRVG